MSRVEEFHVEISQEIIEGALTIHKITSVFSFHDVRFFTYFGEIPD